MKKKNVIRYFITSSLCIFSLASYADNLNVFGTLMIAPCKVSPEHSQIDVPFQDIRLDDIYKHYFEFEKKDFSIILSECELSIAKQVKIKFEGQRHNELTGSLALDESANNPDLGIRIATKNGELINIGEYSNLFDITNNGTFNLNFIAYLQATSKAISNKSIQPGHFSATAVFSLKYE